jgi:quercetin dioxygenase-like cupin family protein
MSDQPGRTPRLSYTKPTLIRAGEATPYRWGDEVSGYVEDEVLISSTRLHSIIFTLPPRGRFVHSAENPTIFRADIVYVVLEGSLVLADPEHGQVVKASRGEALFFRRDTWHDGFNRESAPARVLELFAPTPAAGASSAYAKAQPFLERSRYGNDHAIGRWPDLKPTLERQSRIRLVTPAQRLLRLEGDVLWGLIASTVHLHAATGELPAGGAGPARVYGGDACLHVTSGEVIAAAAMGDDENELTLGPGDTLIAPQGTRLGLRCGPDRDAAFILGVAPAYDATVPPT